ncbi:hypothetical protein CMU78_05910 [Elizabethkingia anophelis]|nr:hypothetical protein [Elizabethkingia anophelis]MDV3688107.1 hypothetical protein [Elizabethkingia anophelis]MDV3785210.1 hypothetical protein [Elizabethkingia anophelis]MDV3817280.1 hypothetical protein [Elizabethkingia anophelis]MDV3827509.1 hypothetical protein [Elizabethkingia anophelis]
MFFSLIDSVRLKLKIEVKYIGVELKELKNYFSIDDSINQPFLPTFEWLLKFDMISFFDNVKVFSKRLILIS